MLLIIACFSSSDGYEKEGGREEEDKKMEE